MTSSYFENLLCAPHLPVTEELNPIFPNTITEASAVAALLPITDDDIQAVLFSIPDTKAPGPDGYNALFFKKSWDVIKYDFIAAIKYFFSNNSLPRCVNATRVALVPKQEHPTTAYKISIVLDSKCRSSMFIQTLPMRIPLEKIESILACILMESTSLSPTGSKVAWNANMFPLHEEIKNQYGQLGFTGSSCAADPFGNSTCPLIHLGHGGKSYRPENYVEAGSFQE
uniref:Reverse transcriptase n=1 Tax=Populus alba TaxID=43335 RepID=A0A4U5QC56_POPAL|nr:hypothetical protein D5086_0000109860 [Populus alba]